MRVQSRRHRRQWRGVSDVALVLRGLALLAIIAAVLKAMGLLSFVPQQTPREMAAEFLEKAQQASVSAGSSAIGSDSLFTNVAPDVGIDYVHDNGARGNYWFPELVGPGGAFIDYDNDEDLDIFIVGGGPLTKAEGESQRCKLYRNDGKTFTDVSSLTGADTPGPGMGVACADYDNDGDVDILVTRVGPNALLRNNGNGHFEDVAPQVGADDSGWGTSAAFLDYDKDGHLDLYVTNYVLWSPQNDTPCQSNTGVRDYCGPLTYESSRDTLLHNRGDGTFEDVSNASGIGLTRGNGLGVVACDFDGDGWEDMYVANDQVPAMLWKNNGDGTFTNVSVMSGSAYDSNGVAIAGMGIACEDLDHDGDFDLLVTNIRDQTDLVLFNNNGFFEDRSLTIGAGSRSIPVTSFGVAVFDQNNDGNFDAYFANGAVTLGSAIIDPDNPYAQPDHFVRFENGLMIDATGEAGIAFADVGRGSVTADFDNDGDLDVLLTNNKGPARLFRNNNGSGNNWLMVDCRIGPNQRTAIGAVVKIEIGDDIQYRGVRPQQSYLNSGDPRVHFGLGPALRIDRVTVTWPDGSISVRAGVDVNQVLTIVHTDDDGTDAS